MLCHAQAINTTWRILNGRYINKNSGRWDEDHSPPALGWCLTRQRHFKMHPRNIYITGEWSLAGALKIVAGVLKAINKCNIQPLLQTGYFKLAN